MEKIKLNNQIVLMRKYVKQAKVHIINKLVKQVKLLQNRKGNDAQVQKAKRKAERFLEEITLLKKIKPDYVSKLALSKASNWKDILQKKNSTLHDRCVAMLANYGAVEKQVKAFHSSNEDLVLKIPDLIKQWDEKNKCSEGSSKNKISLGKAEKRDRKKDEQKTDRNMLNNEKNKTNIKTGHSFASEEEDIKENMSDSSNENDNQSNTSIHPSEISVSDIIPKQKLDSNVDAVEITSESKSVVDCLKNTAKTEEYLKENIMDIENSNINEDSENEDVVPENFAKKHKSNHVENISEAKYPNSDEDLEENSIADSDTNEESEEDSDSIDDVTETQQTIKNSENSNNVAKLEKSSDSKYINDANGPEKKLKAIALLNLDELQGLDEIPIDNTAKNDKSDESDTESSEDDAVEVPCNKRNDPFFLGCGDEDSVAEKKLPNFPRNNDYSLNDKPSAFSDSRVPQRGSNTFFERKGNSIKYNNTKNFQKFSKDAQFSRKSDTKFQRGRDTFKPFQKDKSTVRNYQGKFQPKDKNDFNRNPPKSKEYFKTKEKSLQNFREKKQEDNSQYNRNSGHKFPVKLSEQHKKGNPSDKPLHPSWEAKRKQKELITTSFQGKRILFDE